MNVPVKNIARRHGVIVVASIHQPNWETFALFDKLLLLARGRTMYFGPTRESVSHADYDLH